MATVLTVILYTLTTVVTSLDSVPLDFCVVVDQSLTVPVATEGAVTESYAYNSQTITYVRKYI